MKIYNEEDIIIVLKRVRDREPIDNILKDYDGLTKGTLWNWKKKIGLVTVRRDWDRIKREVMGTI